jgi:eukaryotic-like serine/threonine-protein kinase
MPKHCPKCDRAIPERARGGICPYCALYDAVRGHEAPTLEFADHTKRGFIFCLFAVQLGHATAEQFIQVGVDWVSNPETDFLGEFQKVADIDPEKLALLNQLTDVAIEHHGDDVEKTLQGMGLEHGLDDLAELSLAPYAKADPTLPEPPMALNIDFADPRVIQEDRDRYTRKSEYSRGGMGRILLVHDQFLARDIALKELLPHGLQGTTATPGKETPLKRTAGMVARFLREAKITGQLEHPNIVPVYELGRREEGSFYYTMKLIRGESMSATLKNTKNMDERMALLPHFVDLCQAVAYAHSRQVVHRDLKPSNIMLGPFGETVVIDWGLAKVVGQTDDVADEISSVLDSFRLENADDDEFRTRTGARLGTPAYMSPEQARGEISTIGPQSDVFSLGSMLYELLTGSPPFDDKPVSLLLQRIAHDQVPAVGTVGRDLPPELSAICDRALRHDVDDRYEDAGALLEDLRSFVSGAVVSAHRYSIVQMVKRVYRRNRDAINVALVGAAALVLLSIYSYVQIYNERDEAVQARDEAQELGYINGIKLVDTYLDESHHNLAGARSVLEKLEPTSRGWEWQHLSNRTNAALQEFEGVTTVEWFPSGER